MEKCCPSKETVCIVHAVPVRQKFPDDPAVIQLKGESVSVRTKKGLPRKNSASEKKSGKCFPLFDWSSGNQELPHPTETCGCRELSDSDEVQRQPGGPRMTSAKKILCFKKEKTPE